MFLHIKKMTVAYLAVIFFVAIDQILKSLATSGLVINLIGEIFKFNFVKNYYIAFSLPVAGLWLTALILIIILFLIYYLALNLRQGERLTAVSLLTIILGAASNLFDRLQYGYVVDYLDLKYFTVFNLADVMIIVGVVSLLFFIYKKEVN